MFGCFAGFGCVGMGSVRMDCVLGWVEFDWVVRLSYFRLSYVWLGGLD